MANRKNKAPVTALIVVLTAAVAVCVSLVFVKTGVLPSLLNSSEPQQTSDAPLQSQTSEENTTLPQSEPEATESTEPSSQATSQTEQSTQSVKKEELYTTADLNVRTGPGTQYDKVGLIPKGSKVTRLGEENGWSRIEYDSGEKYVSSQYLTKEKPSQDTTQCQTNISQVKRKVVDPTKGDWNLIVVNAYIEYKKGYKPELKEVCPGMGYDRYMDVRAADHFTQMYNAAKEDGITLVPLSGYRSYELQERNWKARIQSEQAKGYSYNEAVARASEVILPPGTSEHNLGIAMDICSLYESFANTREYAWLCEHAEDYGFILRYKAEWKSKTGIVPEPWHWRYVGVENAKKINESGLCLEDYVAQLG